MKTKYVKDTDMGYARIKREVQVAKNQCVVIGIQEGTTNPKSALPVAVYGAINEFGKKGQPEIPERSFMRSTFDENENSLFNHMKRQRDDVFLGRKTILQALAFVGNIHKIDIKEKIRVLKYPPNANRTIMKKGFDDPLIETKTMMNEIDYKIRRK